MEEIKSQAERDECWGTSDEANMKSNNENILNQTCFEELNDRGGRECSIALVLKWDRPVYHPVSFSWQSNRDFPPSRRPQTKGINEPLSLGKQEGGSGEAPLMAESDKLIFSRDPACSPFPARVSCSALADCPPPCSWRVTMFRPCFFQV